MKQQESHIFSGMQRDVSASKHPAQFIYDGLNVRLTARDGDTLLSLTNEKGTVNTEVNINGNYLGHCLLNEFLVIFSKGSSNDYITKIDLSHDTPVPTVLYEGNLGFAKPIKAIPSYESKEIQKVYWTDGENQPRIINITRIYSTPSNTTVADTKFDFIRELKLEEDVQVLKITNSSGEFAPGVIQYSFTYFDKYGQETNIFHTTPLLYISHFDRGGSPEDKISNSFQITITGVDDNFEFLRIYSIHRTSINGTPICKRVQDIEIASMPINSDGKPYTKFIDTGREGDSIEPAELLYKGGEEVIAKTIEQKDGTLFLGNITLKRKSVKDIQDAIRKLKPEERKDWFKPIYRYLKGLSVSTKNYEYQSQLTASSIDSYGVERTVPCGGFKRGDTYRCGIQFQHKSGKWSEPVFIDDILITNFPSLSSDGLSLPALQATIPANIIKKATDKGYRKVRPLVVFPDLHDRTIVCQGVACPTLSTDTQKEENNPYAQSSWFFRPYHNTSQIGNNDGSTAVIGGHGVSLFYIDRNVEKDKPQIGVTPKSPTLFRQAEIQGHFNSKNQFNVNGEITTLHSPDVEFDDQIAVTNFNNMVLRKVGSTTIKRVFSSIDIQTETPTVSKLGSGPVNKSYTEDGNYGIVSGLYYDDMIVDDDVLDTGRIGAYPPPKQSAKFLIYPWQGTGSLNNDMNRPADKGIATAILKKKVISNLRFADTTLSSSTSPISSKSINRFDFDEIGIVKLNNLIYQGNIDTSLVPDMADGVYLCCNSITGSELREADTWIVDDPDCSGDEETPINSSAWLKTWSFKEEETSQNGLRKWFDDPKAWAWMKSDDIGNSFVDLVMKKLPVRMKYKSTPHLVFSTDSTVAGSLFPKSNADTLPVIEVTQEVTNRFGGATDDALKANTWVPCGKEVYIQEGHSYPVQYLYGDTYFQRYDCLKTYPFTKEDTNQIVEIGSFMLETRVNIDGRYDRNRGQTNNINMSPQNFNLINPVYSQIDNFFSYKILDEDYYKNTSFPNQITWTQEKKSSADVDLWTNITLASTYDMDGSKGEVISLDTWKDKIFCFQNKGVSNILFNSRVQIPTSDNNPIEISNSYKVDGYRYLSDGIGCSDERLIKNTPAGIYFIDSVGNHLLQISDNGLIDLSEQCNMTTWFKDNAGSIRKLLYDDINHDVYGVQDDQVICFSEKLNQFTGFYSYGGINLIESYDKHVFTLHNSTLYKMFEGKYCHFFEANAPWSLTFISNGGNDMFSSKIFTNLEFRAVVEGEGTINGKPVSVNVFDDTFDYTFHTSGETPSDGKYQAYIPVDSLETWNEYQHGISYLDSRNGHAAFQHHKEDGEASLKRKFRIWRCDIPRDNYPLTRGKDIDISRGIYRYYRKPTDRMRNPWLFVKLQKNEAAEGEYLHKTELHDLLVTYFN